MKARRQSWFRLVGAVLAFLAACPGFAQTALPNGTAGAVYSFQVTTDPAAAADTVYAASGLPPGLSISVANGLINGKPTTAGNYASTLSLLSGGETNNFEVTIAIDPPAGTLTITSGATAPGTVGTAFNYITTTSAVAGAPAVSFNLNALPPGLVGNSTTGAITGTPTTAGSYPVLLSANNLNGTGAVKTVTLTIAPASGAPVITSAATLAVLVNEAPSYTIAESNSPTSVSAVGLPLALSLNPATGAFGGATALAGVSTVGLTAANAAGTSPVFNLTITVGAVPVISSASTANAGVARAFSFAVTATNSPTSYNIAGVPAGLSADTTTGAISGTVAATGFYPITVSANNAAGTGATTTLTLAVGDLPTITSVASASCTVGTPFTFTATANNSATSFVITGLPAGLVASTAGTISGTPGAAGNFPVSVSATNTFGTGPVSTLTLAIAAAPVAPPPGVVTFAPTLTTQPVAQSVSVGDGVSFGVVAAGTAPLTFQWKKDGIGLSGATSSTLNLTSVASTDAGSYVVVVSNAKGFVTSAAVTLTVKPVVLVTPPVITLQPADQNVVPGAGASFTVVATGTAPLTYQWRRNGAAIAGATSALYTLAEVQATSLGAYDVLVSNSAGTTASNVARLTIRESRLMNVSVRSAAGTGEQTLIVGFRIEGTGTKLVLLRGVGPTLTQLGVLGVLADPQLKLFNSAGVQANQNEDWGGGEVLAAAFARAGAFALPSASKDAALLISLPAGPSTAHVTSSAGVGVALIEAYDADPGSSPARIINISARTQVGIGENILIAGFVIDGTVAKTVLIRGVGPGLVPLGISATGVLADPQLRLFNAAGQVLQENDNWGGSPELAGVFARAGAFALPGANSKDAALLVTLPPGGYTAQVSGVGNTTGVALIEVYEAP